jgi:hypothetical protein
MAGGCVCEQGALQCAGSWTWTTVKLYKATAASSNAPGWSVVQSCMVVVAVHRSSKDCGGLTWNTKLRSTLHVLRCHLDFAPVTSSDVHAECTQQLSKCIAHCDHAIGIKGYTAVSKSPG